MHTHMRAHNKVRFVSRIKRNFLQIHTATHLHTHTHAAHAQQLYLGAEWLANNGRLWYTQKKDKDFSFYSSIKSKLSPIFSEPYKLPFFQISYNHLGN